MTLQIGRRSGAFFRVTAVASVLCCLAATPALAKPLQRMLVVYENESTLPAIVELAQGLRSRLVALSPPGIELYAEHLDTVRFPDKERIGQLVGEISTKYRSRPPDVIVAVGPGALSFVTDHRTELGLSAPIVFGGISNARQNQIQPPGMSGVISYFDIPKTIDLAMRLQPSATRIVVVTGSSNFDRDWETTARAVLPKTSSLPVEYWTNETLEGLKQKAGNLGPTDILLILSVFKDASGAIFVPREATAQITAAAGAPSYSVYSTFIGFGIVGGYVEPFQSMGEALAELAYDVAQNPDAEPRLVRSPGNFAVDTRALQRWGLDFGRLPEGSVLQFYEPPAWERYRLQITITLAVIAAQTITITALVIQGRRRRRIEQELTLERLELAHLSRTSQLGELSGAFAHELRQPLTTILANAEAGVRLLRKEPLDREELGEIFGDIVKDNKRAAGVIAQLRELMVKGEAKLEPMSLDEAVDATMVLVSSELVARQTSISFRRGSFDLRVLGNFAQLQQVILNLILNAAEAMVHLQPGERQIDVETSRREDGSCELAVADRGPGMAPEMRATAFKPFVSTKPKGLGLGLAICRSIVAAHGGTLNFDERMRVGTRIILVLPPV